MARTTRNRESVDGYYLKARGMFPVQFLKAAKTAESHV
jgi:hypothetical protein